MRTFAILALAGNRHHWLHDRSRLRTTRRDTPAAWRIDYPQAAEVANTKWWEQFGDPALNQLVDSALRENLDVRIAAARVDQFVGALESTRSQLYPQIGYGADANRVRASRVGQPPIPDGVDNYFSLYQASLGASWQLDLFGRVRRLSEASQAQVYASEQAQHGVVLSLVAGVTTSYIVLRALDRQLEIAQATASNFNETARIFDLRFKAGIVAKTDVMQVTSQAQQALAAIPAFEQAIAAQENLISLLLGRNPGPIPRGKTLDQLVAPADSRRPALDAAAAAAGHPAGRAEPRSDECQCRRHARALLPEHLDHGCARQREHGVRDLLTRPRDHDAARGRRDRPDLHVRRHQGPGRYGRGRESAGWLVYRQTVLNAFRETNDALTGSQKKIDEVAMQQKRVDALREFARLSTLRFDKGVAGYLDVLVAENELFAADLASVRLQADRYAQVVAVYQAMGGGWVDIAELDRAQAAEASVASGL